MEDLIGLLFIILIWVAQAVMRMIRGNQEEAPPQEQEQNDENMREIWEEIFGEELPKEEAAPTAEPVVGERPRMEEVVREKTVQPSRPKPQPVQKPRYEVPKGLEPSYKDGMSFEDFVAEARRDRRAKPVAKRKTASQRKKSQKRRLSKSFDLRQAVINDAILNRPYK